MNILVICQYYHPEPFRISDICEELVNRGNSVTVVTGTPNYPMGQIYDGYQNGLKCEEILNGVVVHRCNIHPRKSGSIHRLWNYYSYVKASSKYINKLDNSFDVVFINQLSPVMMAKAGIKYAKKWNKKTVLYCLDLWPLSLSAGGVGNNSFIYKWFYKEAKRVYKNVDSIFATSKSFLPYLETQFDILDVNYLPQYAEDSFDPEFCKKKADGYIDLMFAGNIGTAQSVITIINAANECKDISNLRFHIVGDGTALEECKKTVLENNMNSVIFYGRKRIEEMPQMYQMADAMLVTLTDDDFSNYTLPGKVQSYMAAGKPIIASANGEVKRVVDEARCGYTCDAEDFKGLAQIIRRFIDIENKDELSLNASKYYHENFSKENFISRLIKGLEEQL